MNTGRTHHTGDAQCAMRLCAMRYADAASGHGPWAVGHGPCGSSRLWICVQQSDIQHPTHAKPVVVCFSGAIPVRFFPTGGGPGFPRLQKRCLEWRGVLKCKACKQDEMQCKTEVADMLRNDLASCSASNNDSKFLLLGTRE